MNADDRYYLDTSAILPYYREEAVSKLIQQVLISLNPPVYISSLTRVEFMSGLARLVRMSDLSDGQAGIIADAFIEDVKSGLYMSTVMAAGQFKQAEIWLASRKTSLRTLDALHLASCKAQEAILVTCDAIFSQSADSLGIRSLLVLPEGINNEKQGGCP